MTAHPDAELLVLCDHLREKQVEWQRLYDATSDSGPLTTPADLAWKNYSDDVWPGIRVSTWGDRSLHPDDVPGRLRTIRATTAEGQGAKARAILALEEASAYLDCRDDAIELMLSLVRDVAGMEAHGLEATALAPVDRMPARPMARTSCPSAVGPRPCTQPLRMRLPKSHRPRVRGTAHTRLSAAAQADCMGPSQRMSRNVR